MVDSIEKLIISFGTKVVIVDNLTYLGNDLEKAKEAKPLMKKLKNIKEKYGISIMALAHTPKRDRTKPLVGDNLNGSKMLFKFCDSALAVGGSNVDKSIRYLKQIKARNLEILYDADNVIECQIIKKNSFLQFEFIRYGKEGLHLKTLTDQEKEQIEQDILALWETNKKLSYREIGRQLNINHMKVKRTIERHKKEAEETEEDKNSL